MMSLAALVLLVLGGGPCIYAICRGEPVGRLVALQCLSMTLTAVLVLLAEAARRPAYLDVPLVLALVSFAGTLVFARFFGRLL